MQTTIHALTAGLSTPRASTTGMQTVVTAAERKRLVDAAELASLEKRRATAASQVDVYLLNCTSSGEGV